MRASGPTSARTRSRRSSSTGPSNCCWLAKVHHRDRVELELGAELGVGEYGEARRGRVEEPAQPRSELRRAHEYRLDALHLGLLRVARDRGRELLGDLRIEREVRAVVARAQRLGEGVLDE